MPYQWNAERERQMLLLAISRANLRPSADTWSTVAAILGGGLTASAVSQKYYKLRSEAEKKLQTGQIFATPPTTPTKRKREADDVKTPTKRARKSAQKQESHDGEPFSDISESSSFTYSVKDEEKKPKIELDALQQQNSIMYLPDSFYSIGHANVEPELGMMSSSNGSSSF